MANWSTLKTAVASIINTNGTQAITGQLLQDVLSNIITNVGENATFAGVATLTTNPGAPDGPVFYLAATPGIYANFNGISVSNNEAVVLEWKNDSWTKKSIGFATKKNVEDLESETIEPLYFGAKGSAKFDVETGTLTISLGYIIPFKGVRNFRRIENIKVDFADRPSDARFGIAYLDYKEYVATSDIIVQGNVRYYYWSDEEDFSKKNRIILAQYAEGNIIPGFIFRQITTEEFNRIKPLYSQVEETSHDLRELVGYIDGNNIEWGSTITGKYWNLINGKAGLVDTDMRYNARAELYDVEEGGTLIVTVRAPYDSMEILSSIAAFAAYDSLLNPADGVTARINYSERQDVINNGDGTYTFFFIIPKNCSKIGLFWTSELGEEYYFRYYTEGEGLTWSSLLNSHIKKMIDELVGNDFLQLVGKATKNTVEEITWENVQYGYYWNLNEEGKASLISTTNYYAKPNLIQVNAGSKLHITGNPEYMLFGSAAFGAYDNDRNAYDGVNARIEFPRIEEAVLNSDGTCTHTFTIPAGCTQIGVFYKVEPLHIKIEGFVNGYWSTLLDKHILEVARTNNQSDSDAYFLKGASPKSFEKKICILAAGQSNIDGRVKYDNMPSEIKAEQPLANTHYIKNDKTGAFAPINIVSDWGFDLITYYNIFKRANKELYVIKWAQGGTSIDEQGDSNAHWTADYEKIANGETSLLKNFEEEIRYHIVSDGNNFDIRAMLWHQGEGDRGSLGTGSADRYYINLRNMIAYIRGVVGNETLPFITGTISHKSGQYDATIEDAQKRLASEDAYFYLIDMSGASLMDSYHFDAASSEYLGKMCYDKLIDAGVITGEKINPVRPW